MKKIIIILFIVVLILACEKKQVSTNFAEVSFTVDKSLLSEEYHCTNAGISFYPPINWDQISLQLLNSIKENLSVSIDTTGVVIIPLNVFMDMESSFTCFLSTIESTFMADETINNYIAELKMSNYDLKFNAGLFSYNGFDFHQLIFTKDELITIKLIAANSEQKIFMIDYILPVRFYEKELRSIESSIGTIKKI
ncbi:MAG: hypothetical protein P9L97_04215 [Candidatus Tenebribacter davisii]|nr:hypothetical protein [Candidatus Tenebribacter davisii]